MGSSSSSTRREEELQERDQQPFVEGGRQLQPGCNVGCVIVATGVTRCNDRAACGNCVQCRNDFNCDVTCVNVATGVTRCADPDCGNCPVCTVPNRPQQPDIGVVEVRTNPEITFLNLVGSNGVIHALDDVMVALEVFGVPPRRPPITRRPNFRPTAAPANFFEAFTTFLVGVPPGVAITLAQIEQGLALEILAGLIPLLPNR